MPVFYTYLWLREDGTPYYVGKGKGKRAIRKGSPADLNCILIQEHESESDAFFVEKFLIAYYGRKDIGTGILRNRTDGGEGVTGHRHSEESRQKIKVKRATQVLTAERNAKCGSAWRGKKRPLRSAEWNNKIRQAKLGKKSTMTELNLRRLAHLATLNTSDKGKKAAETRWGK